MKTLKFSIALLVTIGFTYLLNTNSPLGISDMPAFGKLLSPYQGFWQNTKADHRANYRNKKLKGLKENVEIVYDERLVPHLFAQNLEDLSFAQGYITAQHRLWQMDVATRAASGRLSEVLGERTLEMDKRARRRGMVVGAEKSVEEWSKSKNYYLIEAYVAGINAYINALTPAQYPIEFKLLGYEPEAWSILKSALFLKNMALTLNYGYDDVGATNALKIFGKDVFNFLYPEINPKELPIIPAGTIWKTNSTKNITRDTSKILLGNLSPFKGLDKTKEGIGSNNWAVAGSKTASGKPILCSDPHLDLTLPSIWYEIQLQSPEVNVYGVSLPCLPFVIIGFNDNIAWGVTNVGHDVTDWYELDWIDSAKTVYRYDDEARKAELRIEAIKVKGKKTVIDTVRWTHYGPVMYESDETGYKDLAMRWLSVEAAATEEFTTFLLLNQAKNYDDYSKALTNFVVPAQNFVFAAKDGDIALKANGRLPIRQASQGRFIMDGSTSRNEWQGFIPMDEVPQVKNPMRGFVSSANQRSTDETYPYYYLSEGFEAYRGRILNRELEKAQKATIEDMMALQTSSKSILAEEATPLLLAYLDKTKLNPLQMGLVQILETWDFNFNKEAIAPILFLEWSDEVYQLLWDEISIYKDSLEILPVRDWKTIEMMELHPLSAFWDNQKTPQKETPVDIITQAFLQMWERMKDKLEGEKYTWKDHRGTYVAHLSRSIKPFGRYDVPTDGYRKALNAVGKTSGPSWRMVVELGDEIKAYGVYPGGQSGHPGSAFYDNMIDQWASGKYYELFFMKDANDNRQPSIRNQRLRAK
jgi:penicillin amidase